jgi:hypothetical protein
MRATLLRQVVAIEEGMTGAFTRADARPLAARTRSLRECLGRDLIHGPLESARSAEHPEAL